MRYYFIRLSLILAFSILAVFLVAPSSASAASCVSEGNEPWTGGFTCDGVPDQTPTTGDYVTISTDHTITLNINPTYDSLSVDGTLVIGNSNVTLTSQTGINGILDLGTNDLTVNNTTLYGNYGSTVQGSGTLSTRGVVSLSSLGTFNSPLEVVSGATTCVGTFWGTISVQVGATLMVEAGNFLDAHNDMTIHGTLSGGDSASNLSFYGTSLTNIGGSVSLNNVYFRGTGPQTLNGAGSWTGTGLLIVDYGSETSLTNDVIMSFSQFYVSAYSSFSQSNHTLIIDSATTLSLTNNGTFDMGSQTLALYASDGATFHNSGATIGSGTFQTSGTVALYAGGSGAFSPSLNVASGATTASGDIYGAITVQAGATLEVPASTVLYAHNNMRVHGTLSGGNSDSALGFMGTIFTNSGLVSLANVGFDGTGPQTITGSGSWTGTGALYIGYGSETTLDNDVTMAFSQYGVGGGVFSLNNHILLFNPPTTLTFSNNGTFDIGNQILAFHAPGGATFGSHTTSGTGTFQTSGTVDLYIGGGYAFQPQLAVASGTTTSYGNYHGAITVQPNATLYVPAGHRIYAYNNVTIHGTLSVGDPNSALDFYGPTFTNTGSVLNLGTVSFRGSGPQTIGGIGSWTGTGRLNIEQSSETTLTNDVTVALSQIIVNYGILSLDNHTLTFGTPGGATFTNYGTTAGSGTFQTSGTVSLLVGYSNVFAPSLNVASGTATVSGSIGGAITVQNGATVMVEADRGLYAYGDVTINGILGGGNSNSSLYFYGTTFTNSGSSVSLNNVYFYGTGPQAISGAGSWTSTGAITISSETILANDVTMAFSLFSVSGSLSLGDHNLTTGSPGGTTFSNYGTIYGTGVFRTTGMVSFYNGGTFNPSLDVDSGTTTAGGSIQGAISVQAGATLLVQASSGLSTYGDVAVHGTLSDGDSNSFLRFSGTGPQTISGAGSWTSTGILTIENGSETTLANDVTMAFSQYEVRGVFSLGDHTLTFNLPTALNFQNDGTFDIGSHTLAFHAPDGATFYNGGTTTGTGTFQTSGTVSLSSYGTFSSLLNVASGTTVASGLFHGAITVQAGATLRVPASSGLYIHNDLTVQGTLSDGDSNSLLFFSGTGPQTIRGAGSWTGSGSLYIEPSSVTTLGDDVTMAFGQYDVRGVFSLGNHSLTFNSSSALTFYNWGSFDIGSQTLAFHAPDGATFYNYGTTTGNGTFQTSGVVRIASNGAFSSLLEVASGTSTADGTIQGAYRAITVQAGATLMIPANYGLFISGDIAVHGTLSGGDSMSFIYFSGTGPQTISGTGSWTSVGRLFIDSGSETRLSNSVTMAFSQYDVRGVFSLGDHTLAFNSPTTLTFYNQGTFEIYSQTLAFHAPNGATSYNYGTITGSGTFQTSGTVTLYAGGSGAFAPSLNVASGITTAYGSINGAITVQSGATLMVRASNSLTASDDVSVQGTLSGGNPSSYLYFSGTTFTNNGSSVTVATVYFASGQHTLQGTGSFSNNTARIQNGATVNLGSDHLMSTVVINSGGTFQLFGHTLSLSGAGTPVTNNGVFDTTASAVVYNGTVPQTVATNNIDYYSLGIDNAAGVTLGGMETVPGSLILTNGRLFLGARTLTLGNAATIGGTPSVAAMVVADGDGFLRKTSAGPLTFTFPIGDSSGNYTPASLDCTTFPAGGAVDARLRDTKHPTMPGTTYLTRYWTLTSAATNAGCTALFTYVQDDVAGVEASLAPTKYDGLAWTLLGSGAVDVTANTLTGTFETFSDFSGGEVTALAVNLASFNAEPMRDGVLVSWETESELGNRGFNLWRSTSPEGPVDQLNSALIPSQSIGSPQGFTYTWQDSDVVPGQTYWYWLEDVGLNGATTLHGPVSATVYTPTAVTLSELSTGNQQTKAWPGWLDNLAKVLQKLLTPAFSGLP